MKFKTGDLVKINTTSSVISRLVDSNTIGVIKEAAELEANLFNVYTVEIKNKLTYMAYEHELLLVELTDKAKMEFRDILVGL